MAIDIVSTAFRVGSGGRWLRTVLDRVKGRDYLPLLIKPDMKFSLIRLSDILHLEHAFIQQVSLTVFLGCKVELPLELLNFFGGVVSLLGIHSLVPPLDSLNEAGSLP